MLVIPEPSQSITCTPRSPDSCICLCFVHVTGVYEIFPSVMRKGDLMEERTLILSTLSTSLPCSRLILGPVLSHVNQMRTDINFKDSLGDRRDSPVSKVLAVQEPRSEFSSQSQKELGVVTHICNSSTEEERRDWRIPRGRQTVSQFSRTSELQDSEEPLLNKQGGW